jgi:3-hydroxyacyl-CoA dehydrogenase
MTMETYDKLLDACPNQEWHTIILGAGMMGTAIAAAHLRCKLPVTIYDSNADALHNAPKRIAEELRLQDVALPENSLTCIENTDELLDELAGYSIIIETITEKLKAKQKLYQKLTENLNPDAVLFTNTSTISISLLAQHLPLEWQHRFCGFHFFHPVRQRSLVEIVAGEHTNEATIETAKTHAGRIDKRYITVGDSPGFLVNRILNPYLSSALSLLEEGVDLERIERIALQFGMKMGPFRIMDEIGLDVVLHAGWVLHKAFPDRTPQSAILLRLVEQGKLGRKTGHGFMLYPNQTSWDGEGVFDPQFASSKASVSDTEIVSRLFVSMYEEAIRCFNEGVVSELSSADEASIEALGFPAEKGGIATWGEAYRNATV